MTNPTHKKHSSKKTAAPAHVVHHHSKSADRHFKPGILGIYSPIPVTAVAGETFDLQLRANGTVDEWKAKGLPSGLIINETNGNISGTPDLPGSSKITIEATHLDVIATMEFILDVV